MIARLAMILLLPLLLELMHMGYDQIEERTKVSNDHNYQSKKERIEELKNNRPRKGKVVSFDEKTE